MKLTDIARGAYSRSPAGFRRTVAPLLGLVPTQLRYGRTYRLWRERISSARFDEGTSTNALLASLQGLLKTAHQSSPYYREILAAAFGNKPDWGTITPASLARLPIQTKATLSAAGKLALTVPRSAADIGDTSGSNGEKPFSFFLDKDRSPREMAFVYDAWSRVGYDERQNRACLRGFGFGPGEKRLHEWDPALRELRLAVFPMTPDAVRQYVELIDRYQVEFIYGYTSAIDLMCRHMFRIGCRPKRPIRGVMPISEGVQPHQRDQITRVLNAPIVPFYGMSEKAAFAVELAGSPGIYEFQPLYGWTELVDDDGNLITDIGAEGRIVGTGFLSTAMPFIRYDTMDRGRLIRAPLPQNGMRMRVSDISSRRKPDYLITGDGHRAVTTDFTPDNPRFFKGVSEYQLLQLAPGSVIFRYIPDGEGTAEDAQSLCRDLSARSMSKLTFTPEKVDALVTGRGGKRAFIDQRLDVSLFD